MFKAIKFSLLWIILFGFSGYAQDFSGNWTGFMRSPDNRSSPLELNFSSENNLWKGDILVKGNNRPDAKNQISTIQLLRETIEFIADLQGAQLKFSGTLKSSKIPGTFEVFANGQKIAVGVFCVSKDKQTPCSSEDLPVMQNFQPPIQRADPDYDTKIKNPTYSKNHPKVLFDEAHNNGNTSSGRYKPFVDLITYDGYSVTPNNQKFSADVLKDYDILVISNARGKAENESAFTYEEIEAVAAWVKMGGSLLLIADHAPAGEFAAKLSNRFGVEMSTGVTKDTSNIDKEIGNLLFSRENKLLGVHAITKGRSEGEKINRIVSFTGQSLSVPKGGVAILKFGETAYDEFPNQNKKIPAAGRAQAVAMKFGKGKVVVLGEAAMITAQLLPNGGKFGMNVAGIDNRQFALNIMHWLSELLK